MKKNMTYNEAFNALEVLVEEIETDEIQLDTLAEKVKEANELIKFCETKLRIIDGDIKKVGGEK
jgi:exodeoxyribonuclease VII small subunit